MKNDFWINIEIDIEASTQFKIETIKEILEITIQALKNRYPESTIESDFGSIVKNDWKWNRNPIK